MTQKEKEIAIKLIEEANEELYQLRLKSFTDNITEGQLYTIQIKLHKAIDALKPIEVDELTEKKLQGMPEMDSRNLPPNYVNF